MKYLYLKRRHAWDVLQVDNHAGNKGLPNVPLSKRCSDQREGTHADDWVDGYVLLSFPISCERKKHSGGDRLNPHTNPLLKCGKLKCVNAYIEMVP